MSKEPPKKTPKESSKQKVVQLKKYASKEEIKRRGVGKQKGLTAEIVLEAIRKVGPFLYLVAKNLKVHRSTIAGWMQRHPEISDVFNEMQENMLDSVEARVYQKAIQNDDTASQFFILKCQGKKRGWIENAKLEELVPSMSSSLTVIIEPDEKAKAAS